MSGKIASIIGATGMIGAYLVEEIIKDDYFDTCRVVVRRLYQNTDPKMEVKLVDFTDAESLKLALEESDTVFCCIGTTQKNVRGDNELYRRIDFDIPVAVARFAKEAGCEKFIIITSVGADRHSNTFYLKLKGELEHAIQALHLRTVHIMQPSMLLGSRREKRTGERLLQGSMKLFSGLLMGSMRKFRAIQGRTVAKAMLNAAKKNEAGFFKHTFDSINELASAD